MAMDMDMAMSMNVYNYDFLIVGAGIAGCYTAMNLSKKYPDKKILLIEKSNRIGGRLYSPKIAEGGILEAGAARFSNRHTLLMKLIDDLGFSQKKIKIGSDVEFVSTNKKFNYDNLPFNSVEDLMRDLVKRANRLSKSSLIKHSLTSFCTKIYNQHITNFLIDAFPYYARIHYMNLYDCLRSLNDYVNYDRQFYALVGGLQQLPLECAKIFKKNGGKIHMEHKLKDINGKIALVENKNGSTISISANKIIIAIPQEFLKQIPLFNKTRQIKDLVRSVEPYELMRVYAKYPIDKKTGKVWFADLPGKISTNNKIHFIIQINPKKGIIMIAYPNSDYTHYWNRKNKEGNAAMNDALEKYLKQLFPDVPIPKPKWIKSFFWNTGGNIWLPGKDSDTLSKKMLQPFNNNNNNNNNHIYVIGESYSQWQAWVEGALQTSNQFLKMV